MGPACGGDRGTWGGYGIGTAPAWCFATLCCAPPKVCGTRCHAHSPAAGQQSRVLWGNGTGAAQHRHRGFRQSRRCAAQPGHGASIQAHSGNLPSTRPGRLSLAGCPLSMHAAQGAPLPPQPPAQQSPVLEGFAAGERPGREMQQSSAGKERDAGGGGGTPAPLAVATATPAVRSGQQDGRECAGDSAVPPSHLMSL